MPFIKFGSYDLGAGLSSPTMIRTYASSTWVLRADNIYMKQDKLFFSGKSQIFVLFEPSMPYIYMP